MSHANFFGKKISWYTTVVWITHYDKKLLMYYALH